MKSIIKSKNIINKYATLLRDIKKNRSCLVDIINTNKLFPPIFKGMKVIEIGISDANNIITLFGDPSDDLFIQAYQEIKDLTIRNKSIKILIILMGFNHNKKNVNKFIKILLSLPIEKQQVELESFLKLKGKNISYWMRNNYRNITISEESNKSFNLYGSWLEISEKKSLPILLLNSVEIPTLYSINDIEFITEILEVNKI